MKTALPLKEIVELGFDVYIRPNQERVTYAYYTDGKNIGYIQYDSVTGMNLSTIHIPNHQTGTGFDAGPLYRTELGNLRAAFVKAPGWASSSDWQASVKYKDWNAFHQANKFNQELIQYQL